MQPSYTFASISAAVVLILGGMTTALADPIPYAASGSYNNTSYSFTAAMSGNITAYFVGGQQAGYTNEMGLLVNGTLTSAGFGLNNHSTALGTSFDLGMVNAGDVLTFVLHNLSLGEDAYSDPSMNTAYDSAGVTGHNHIYSTAYTATSPILSGAPTGTYIAFEDLPFPGSDFNYNDESFVFTNVATKSSSVPEPDSLALIGLGMVGMGLNLRNKKA
jgi:PEP-CTERM putative exosortase interaction domain